MFKPIALVGALLLTLPTAALSQTVENTLVIEDFGTENTLEIVQTPQASNVAMIRLGGSGNGASSNGTWYPNGGRLFSSVLTPGTLVQDGFGHKMTISLAGTANLFAARQTGRNHTISAVITGQANQVSVRQAGTAQRAVFRQAGSRNSLSIRQSSW